MKKTVTVMVALAVLALGSMNLTGCETGESDTEEKTYSDLSFTYKFEDGGTYQKLKKGTLLIDSGSYIVKDNVLALLRDFTYSSAEAAAAAVEKYTFAKDSTSIALTNGLGKTIYTLSTEGVPATLSLNGVTATKLAGKKWKSGPNSGNMWNVWDFNSNGTFGFTHYHSADNSESRGTYSYLVKGDFLITLTPAYEVNAYAISVADQSFTLTPAAGGGNTTYTLLHDADHTHDHKSSTYAFNADGTYSVDSETGGYIVRDNVLAFLKKGTYANASEAATAVNKYTFVKDTTTISLISDTETRVYTLDNGGIPTAITPSDKIAGENWKASGTGMYNWYGFRTNGTYHYYHYMSNKADYIDRGDFGYLVQNDILITLSASDSPSKNPASPSYTVSAYTLTFSDEDNKVSFQPVSGSAVDLTKLMGMTDSPQHPGNITPAEIQVVKNTITNEA